MISDRQGSLHWDPGTDGSELSVFCTCSKDSKGCTSLLPWRRGSPISNPDSSIDKADSSPLESCTWGKESGKTYVVDAKRFSV